jgi:hypothetical protein
MSNLKSFKPGQSGNLKGRPKKMPGIDELLAEVITEDARRSILRMLTANAKKGNMKAIEIILDRLYGKAKQSTELTGNMTIEAITGILVINESENQTTIEADSDSKLLD